MVHIIPTHRCQLSCVHCCFKNKKDKTADMPWAMFEMAMSQFSYLGTRALEFTGGGDPALWPYINEAVEWGHKNGFAMGIITNGLGDDKIKDWSKFKWVRVSLNTLEYRDLDLSHLHGCHISFCYIWHENSAEFLHHIVQFSNDHQIVCRMAPDCIQPLEGIEKTLEVMKGSLAAYEVYHENKYVFVSDFNVETVRSSNSCYIHMIKPCLYLDGWVYACPSAELAVENDRQVQEKTRICTYDHVASFYRSPEAIQPREYDCSFCKYVAQQDLLDALLLSTDFNEFA
jgi:MoaA/NifB/PqqE/SkfB family radical SAM enzyme